MAPEHKEQQRKIEEAPYELIDQSTLAAQPRKKPKIAINLRNIPLLAGLDSLKINRVKEELTIRHYRRRDVVMQKGMQCEHLLFLLSGKLQAAELTDEKRIVGLNLLSPGAFFGEVALINQSPLSASVIALNDVLAAFLPGDTARHLFTHCPSVAAQIQHHLAKKVQRDQKFRALLSINNTAKRICSFLVLMKQKTSKEQELVEHLPTHQEIASMINTSRETVTRTLLTLAHQGIIRKDARRLIIINPKALQNLTIDP